jgi:hypothetical protein
MGAQQRSAALIEQLKRNTKTPLTHVVTRTPAPQVRRIYLRA